MDQIAVPGFGTAYPPARRVAAYLRDMRIVLTCHRDRVTLVDDGHGLSEAENRLGLTLPTTMRQLYRRIGRRDDLTSAQDHLLRADQLRVDKSGQVLVFRVENQNCAQWGIEIVSLGQTDPPVVSGTATRIATSTVADAAGHSASTQFSWNVWHETCPRC